MYGKKTYRKNIKKAVKGRKKKFYKKPRATINRALQPFAQRYVCKLRYVDTIQYEAIANVPYVFNLNSLYDPNQTTFGHQPHGFDQLAALYQRYRVFATSWHIRYTPQDGEDAYVIAIPSNNSIAPTSMSDLLENPRCRYVLQNTDSVAKVLKGRISLPSLTGKTKSQYMSDDRYQSDVLHSPLESMQLSLFRYSALNPEHPANGTFMIEITYHAEFFDPKQVNQS